MSLSVFIFYLLKKRKAGQGVVDGAKFEQSPMGAGREGAQGESEALGQTSL